MLLRANRNAVLPFLDVEPVSRVFGFDRGKPVDRYYIEKFLKDNAHHIKGRVLEIADSLYSKKFGYKVEQFEIFGFTAEQSNATIVGDLTIVSTLPSNAIDCFICTQTLNFIYEFKSAIVGIHHLLKPGGIALVTVSGISQISRYDAIRWGDFWRFNPQSIERAFKEIFQSRETEITVMGNSYAATMFLKGFAFEECDKSKLDVTDEDYPVIIGLAVKKT